jgi:hypothetical protein
MPGTRFLFIYVTFLQYRTYIIHPRVVLLLGILPELGNKLLRPVKYFFLLDRGGVAGRESNPGLIRAIFILILSQCGGFDLTTLKVSNLQFLTN